MQGMTLDVYYQFSGQDENAWREQMKEDAEKRVRTNLTLEAIAIEEELEATDEDVRADMEEMAKMYNLEIDNIVEMLGGNTDLVKEDLKIKKAIDFLVEHSVTK